MYLSKDKAGKGPAVDLAITLILAVVVFFFAANNDLLEDVVRFSRNHENLELDEVIVTCLFLVVSLTFFSVRRWLEARRSNQLLVQRNLDLQDALSEIRQLKGIIPICASCKSIRDDEGFWHQVETYISKHSEADFTHSYCPDCIRKLYPALFQDNP